MTWSVRVTRASLIMIGLRPSFPRLPAAAKIRPGPKRSRVACPMLHLTKLAVGVRDIDHLRTIQSERVKANPPLRHRTRNFPRRRDEVVAGGSIYWVVNGATLVRQRILDVIEDHWDDNSACAGLIFDPQLIPVAARPTRPFQGWRYLKPEDAPPDLVQGPPARGETALPPALRRELQALCLL
jgi:hypothetical protein